MRQLTDHIASSANNELVITVQDEPGQGGACHRYDVTGFDTYNNPAHYDKDSYGAPFTRLPIIFQNGPIKEVGVNGVTGEELIAVVIDRLRGFQSGPYKCRENPIALTELEQALMWLQSRTRARIARGVEGTHAI